MSGRRYGGMSYGENKNQRVRDAVIRNYETKNEGKETEKGEA